MQIMESVMMQNMSRYKHLNDRKMEAVMSKYGIRKIDIEIIIYLSNCDGKNTARDIAAMDMFTKGHISQSVKRLSGSGYIIIVQDEKDLRVQHLFLTEKAASVLDDLMKVRKEINDCVFAGITEEEFEVMRNIFEKMYNNISKAIDI